MWSSLNPLGKIGIVGALLGFAVGATAAIIAAPIPGLLFTLFFVVVFGSVFWYAFRPQAKARELMETGEPAQAKILEVRDTGVTINEINPMIKLLLEVQPEEGEPYQTETRLLINRTQIPQFQPGMTIPVMIDPEDREQVAVGRPEGGDTVMMESGADSEEAHRAEQMLIRIDEENKKILTTGQQARAKVLQAHDMGIRVNGPNPAMQFVLEVQHPGGEPFQAEATGVVYEGSVPKFQPGKTIYVKYDPNDLTRVSIYRSY